MVNYDKWNKLDDYSSDEDTKPTSMKRTPLVPTNETGLKAKLISVAWDPYCGLFFFITFLLHSQKK